MADFTSPEAKKLNSILSKLQKEIADLKGTGTTPQLTNSAIDVNEGRGYIPVIENGEVKMRFGRQPDGSIGIVSENNPIPPVMPYAPLCVPLLGGVQVRCQGFVSKQFADFSHVKVYRDQAYYGNIIKVPGSIVVSPLTPGDHQFKLSSVNLSGTESPLTQATVSAAKLAVGDDIADGIITTLKIANDAITEAKIAVDAITAEQLANGSVDSDKIVTGAITASKVAANAIQAASIAAGAISADKIAANAITSDKIAANAVTALQIAANAITSTNIQAGAVDATKLAAQLILASTQIIVGSLTGARLVMDSQGLTQYDSRGNLAVQFGAQANKSNFLTIVDPTDPTNTLASIANDGSISMTGITINGSAKLNGIDLIQYLNNLPRGIVAHGIMPSNTAFYGQGVPTGIFELQFDAQAGKKYKVCTSELLANSNYSGTVAQGGWMSIRYTTNGSIPTVNSTNPFYAAWFSTGWNDPASYNNTGTSPLHIISSRFENILTPSTSGRIRVLYVMTGQDASYNGSPIGLVGPVNFWIEDLGTVVSNTGGNNPGGGTSQANGAYVTTWPCTYSAYAYDTNTSVYPDPHPNDLIFAGTYCGQLNGTNYYSTLDFNWQNIQATLAGATTYKVELYLYSYYWTLATGGYVSIGYHNKSASGSGPYQYVARNIDNFKMAKPEGAWLTLNVGYGNAFRDGSCKGFVLDNRQSPYNNATNYGQFRRGGAYDGEDVQPVLRITYVK